jgi:ADP-heptose:LPS heptosyltransferase
MQPGARDAAKQWPLENFAATSQWLWKSHGLRSVVNVGPGEQQMAHAATAQFGDSGVVLDSLDLRELIALIASAKIFVGNDTGPSHLAAAANIPAVVIFGPTNSTHWRPWHADHRVVQNVSDPKGVASVTPNQIREACESLLATHPSRLGADDRTVAEIPGIETV